MNERIDQLWGQALDLAVPETYTKLSYSQTLKIKQVFAELIVRECLDQLLVSDPTEDFDKGISWSVKQIKQHFGVES